MIVVKNLVSALHRHRWIVLIGSILVIAGMLVVTVIVRAPQPLRMIVANRGSQSATLAFITYQPTSTCAYIFTQQKLLRGQFVCDQKETIHLLEAIELNPDTTYQIWLIINGRLYRPNLTITTLSPASIPPSLPTPAFGSVKDDQGLPISDAMVVAYPDQSLEQAIVTRTNLQGNYALDISPWAQSAKTISVDATTPDQGWGVVTVSANQYAPFKDITINPIVATP